MSGEMQLFKSGAAVPDYLRGGTSDLTRSLAGGDSLKRVSIKGGVFRMMVGSKELAINEERSMNFIVVSAAPAIARTYYEGTYQEGVDTTPVCWSDDGFKPSDKALKPQAASCAMCPKNAKGSGTGDSRACRYSARLAVALEGDLEGGVYGVSIPAMSLFGDSVGRYSPLQDYARKLAQFNVSMEKVVTEFRFDTKAQVPKLMFQAVRPLTKEEYAQVQEMQEEDLTALIGPRTFDPPKAQQSAAVYSAPAADEDEDEDEEEMMEQAPPPRPRGRPPKSASSKRAEAAQPAKSTQADPDGDNELASLLEEWADD